MTENQYDVSILEANYYLSVYNRGFHKYTTLAIMPILPSKFLLYRNRKPSNKMLPLAGIEPGPTITSDSNSNTLLSTLT